MDMKENLSNVSNVDNSSPGPLNGRKSFLNSPKVSSPLRKSDSPLNKIRHGKRNDSPKEHVATTTPLRGSDSPRRNSSLLTPMGGGSSTASSPRTSSFGSGSSGGRKKMFAKRYEDISSPVGEYIRGQSPTVRSPARRRNRRAMPYADSVASNRSSSSTSKVCYGSLPHTAILLPNKLLKLNTNISQPTSEDKKFEADCMDWLDQVSVQQQDPTRDSLLTLDGMATDVDELEPKTPPKTKRSISTNTSPLQQQTAPPKLCSVGINTDNFANSVAFQEQHQDSSPSDDASKTKKTRKGTPAPKPTKKAVRKPFDDESSSWTESLLQEEDVHEQEERDDPTCPELLISAEKLEVTTVRVKGWIKVKGKTEWANQWVIVSNNLLFIFTTQTSSKPSQVILLDKASVSILPEEESLQQFSICTRVGRTICFEADNASTARHWVAAISRAGYEHLSTVVTVSNNSTTISDANPWTPSHNNGGLSEKCDVCRIS